jgi:hypothetical protein
MAKTDRPQRIMQADKSAYFELQESIMALAPFVRKLRELGQYTDAERLRFRLGHHSFAVNGVTVAAYPDLEPYFDSFDELRTEYCDGPLLEEEYRGRWRAIREAARERGVGLTPLPEEERE